MMVFGFGGSGTGLGLGCGTGRSWTGGESSFVLAIGSDGLYALVVSSKGAGNFTYRGCLVRLTFDGVLLPSSSCSSLSFLRRLFTLLGSGPTSRSSSRLPIAALANCAEAAVGLGMPRPLTPLPIPANILPNSLLILG